MEVIDHHHHNYYSKGSCNGYNKNPYNVLDMNGIDNHNHIVV